MTRSNPDRTRRASGPGAVSVLFRDTEYISKLRLYLCVAKCPCTYPGYNEYVLGRL